MPDNNLSEEEKQALLDEEEQKKKEEEEAEALLKEAEQKKKEEEEAEEEAAEKRRKELEELSEEELAALLTEDEINQLKELGFPQFKTVKELAENFKKFIDEDKMTFPIVKELASAFNMTPLEFINAVRVKVQPKKPSATPGKKPGEEADAKYKETVRALESEIGNMRLDMRFDRFQRMMDKKGIIIPDNLKPELIKRLPGVISGMTGDEINSSLLFDKAYDFYLFELSKEKDPEKVREGLKFYDAKKLAKLRQLGISPKKKTAKGATSQDVKDYGEGITKL